MDRRESSRLDDGTTERQGRQLRVLLVEDSEDDALLLIRKIQRGGYRPDWTRVEDAASLRRALSAQEWDLVLADYGLPRFDAVEALAVVQEDGIDLPFIIVSGSIGEEIAVAAMKQGAHDYIMKGNLARLLPAIDRELREAKVRRERRRAEAALRSEALVSQALAQVGSELISALDSPALIDRLCGVAADVLKCDTCTTFMLRPEEEGIAVVAMTGHDALREREAVVRSLSTPEAAISRALEQLDNADAVLIDMPPDGDLGHKTGSGAQLCSALRRGNEVIGLLVAERRHGESFNADELRIGAGLAQLASLALEQARLMDELARASRLKSEFVATMSHELRTPLNVIMGYSDLLLDGAFGSLAPEQEQVFRRIDTSTRQLLDLINATLNLSRLESGHAPLDLEKVCLPEILDQVEAETRELSQRRGLKLTLAAEGPLPEVVSDPAKLKVVLKNLVGNAIKFTEQGTITVRAKANDDGGVDITVSDTGVGIDAETLPIIFEPFRQGDSSSTRRFGGVGLGLYIVQRLLAMLGGSIEVESVVGQGSVFRIHLPREPIPTSEG